MMLKRHLIVLAMMVAVGVFFAGLTIARADSGDDGSDDPTATCTLPGNDQGDDNDQGEDVNDQGEDVQGDDQGEDVQGDDQGDDVQGSQGDDELDGNGGDDQSEAGDRNRE